MENYQLLLYYHFSEARLVLLFPTNEFLLLPGVFRMAVRCYFCVLVVFLSLATEILAREGEVSLPRYSGDGSPATYAYAAYSAI
jgi:hypothetical protein